MRVLGIDHGTKRMGIAISDEMQTIALPVEFIPAEPVEAFERRLTELIREKEVGSIVVGLPRNMDGTMGPAALKVEAFIARLKETTGLPVRAWDERLTSVQANRQMLEAGVRRDMRKLKVDQMAAALILQSFLDSIG